MKDTGLKREGIERMATTVPWVVTGKTISLTQLEMEKTVLPFWIRMYICLQIRCLGYSKRILNDLIVVRLADLSSCWYPTMASSLQKERFLLFLKIFVSTSVARNAVVGAKAAEDRGPV